MDNRNFKWSRFAHIYERDNVIALFHTLNVKVIYLDAQEDACFAEKIRSRSNIDLSGLSAHQLEIAQQLLDLEILIEDDNRDINMLEEVRQDKTGNVDISLMYLMLTDQCNLACRYCFIEGAMPTGHNFSLMTEDTAKKAIDLFISKAHICNNPKHKPTIIFYGGEPTLNWPVLRSAVLYIREKVSLGELPITTEISMVTNGTLLDQDKINFLKENNAGFAVSFDGANELSDGRIFHNGSKTIDTVLKSFDLIRSCEVPLSVSCTISEYNYKHIRDVAKWLCDQQVDSVGFNILMDVPGKPRVTDDLIDTAVTAMTDCYEVFREHGVYEDRIGRKVEVFTNGYLYPFDCAGYGGQMVVAPDGQIGVCHAYLGERKFFDVNVHSSVDFDPKNHPDFVEWSRRSPFNMAQCTDCPVLGICGGGCAKIAETQTGSIWGLDDRFCKHAKHTLEWMIWDLYKIMSATTTPEESIQKGGDEA